MFQNDGDNDGGGGNFDDNDEEIAKTFTYFESKFPNSASVGTVTTKNLDLGGPLSHQTLSCNGRKKMSLVEFFSLVDVISCDAVSGKCQRAQWQRWRHPRPLRFSNTAAASNPHTLAQL